MEKPKRRERANDCADRIHEAFKTEGAAVGVWWRVGGEQGFPRGRADAASEPRGGTAEEHVIGVRRQGKRGGRKRGESVTEESQRLAMLQPVCEVACGKFGEAGEAVGDALDGAEPCGARANRGEKCGQNGCCGFVAPVAEETGETDAEDGAVEPGLLL